MTNVRLLYVTVASADNAAVIGKALVEERLVACANVIDGLRSIYRWEGETCDESEALLLMKTVASNVDRVVARVCDLHDYECPCVVALPVEDGNADFLEWVQSQCRLP